MLTGKDVFHQALLIFLLLTVFAVTQANAANETILYTFKANGTDGSTPYGGLVFDSAGNLYGTTSNGGRYLGGTVFELSPQAGGGWSETVLHTFATGQQPWSSLTIDSARNLYGTTSQGGAFGQGIVFELSPQSGGGWTYTRLHSFGNGKDGKVPYGAPILDAGGNLYGTTGGGGAFDAGTVFELSPGTGGVWTEKILHNFYGNGQDGLDPVAGLTFDGSGNLYGTTFKGGKFNDGTVYRLAPASGGGWKYSILHQFGSTSNDGQFPWAGVILDSNGTIYGTTENGGAFGDGMVFALVPAEGGGYFRKTLHNFHNVSTSTSDGTNPLGALVRDDAGNLYGTTKNGSEWGFGIVFKLSPAATGPWPETILYAFEGPPNDGLRPYAGLIFDAAGSLYGTTSWGTIFEITQ